MKQAVTSWIKQRTPEFFIDGMRKLVLRWEKLLNNKATMSKKLYFTSYFHLFKYMVSFSRYFTVCITYQLPLVVYGHETCCTILREESRLKVFENRVLRKMFGPKEEEVTRHRREVQIEELHDLYSLPNVIWVIKSRRISWVGQVEEKPKCIHGLGRKG